MAAGRCSFEKAEARDFHATYSLGSRLGAGSYGTVYLARRRGCDTEVAVKTISLITSKKKEDATRQSRLLDVMSEVTAWTAVEQHPNILHLHEWYIDFRFAYFVMDLCYGLVQAWKQEPTLNECTYAKYFHGMAAALQHIHSVGVLHCDVKHSNFVVDEESGRTVKLTDFGLAGLTGQLQHLSGGAGSALYMAPETLGRRGGIHGCAADVWSFGVIVYVSFFGEFPYRSADRSKEAAKALIRKGTVLPSFRPPQELEQNPVSSAALDFVRGLLHRNPTARPSARVCLESEYLLNKTTTEAPPQGQERRSLVPMLHRAFPAKVPSARGTSEAIYNEFGLSCMQSRARKAAAGNDQLTEEGRARVLLSL